MLQHPIHREIDQSITLGGLEPDDLLMLALIGYLVGAMTSALHLRVGPIDVTLLASCAGIAAAFSLWLYIRRGRPRYYLRDLLRMTCEPDAWAVTADLHARPPLRAE